MTTSAEPVFRSSAQRGFSSEVTTHPQRVAARKKEQAVKVQFVREACTVQTREGTVHARPGDAIITGTAGERWRVSRSHFSDKYRPVPPTRDGETGTYISLPNFILAVPMTDSFQVVLADGISRLKGRPGDWLVDYGDGSLGVVSPAIFATTYELTG